MKKVKKLAAMLLVISVTITLTAIPAHAVTYYDQAVTLDSLGLLRGTGYGYELELAATRAEAATMLVRLLGKEKEAFAGSYRHPFKDVPIWADKYIGYLYTKGLTKGTSGTTFSPSIKCDTRMFTVFVLRSLGYTEANGDFTYDAALNYAKSMGLIDGELADKSVFLRGDMVAISYAALFESTRGNAGETLLDNLLLENAVDENTAAQLLKSYALYEEYVSALAASLPDGPVQLQQNMSMKIFLFGESDGVATKSLVTVADVGGRTVIKSEDEVIFAGDTEKSTSYYIDGWVYTESGGEKFKYREEASLTEDIIPDSGAVPFYLIKYIEKAQYAGNTEYNIYYNPGVYDDIASVFMAMLGDTAAIIDIPLSTSMTFAAFDTEGRLKSQDFFVTLGVNVKDGELTLPLNLEMMMRMVVLDTGNHIIVTLPADLDVYQELDY